MSFLGLKYPLIVAPMAGGPTTPALVDAASRAGALGSLGAAYLTPAQIESSAAAIRALSKAPFAINLFAPHPQPALSPGEIAAAIEATRGYRDELGLPDPILAPPFEENFDAQFEATLRAKPFVLSYVFGTLGKDRVREASHAGITLIGTATTPDEAAQIEAEGAHAVTLQGFEAGGHRGIFDPSARDQELPLEELLRTTKVKIPVIAAGGLMNRADIQRVLDQGAAAAQLGTAFLACKEAGTSAPYREALRTVRATKTTRAFSGRLARGIVNRFMREMDGGKPILPFPAQNKFTRELRNASAKKGSAEFLSLWSGTGPGALFEGYAHELIDNLFPDPRLFHATLEKKAWLRPRADWDHDHCEFCYATIQEPMQAYWSAKEQTWVCLDCFAKKHEAYEWK